jgi:hypothetical protein
VIAATPLLRHHDFQTTRRYRTGEAMQNSVNLGLGGVKDSLGVRHPMTAGRTVEA